MTRRAISPPPGSVRIPRIEPVLAPPDMTPTVAPPGTLVVVVRELKAARAALTAHADLLRNALKDMDCHPRELTSVLAALDLVLDDETGGGS